jgi:hypothetical protein
VGPVGAAVVADGVVTVGVVAAGLVVVGVAVPQAVMMKTNTNKITRGIVNFFNSNLLNLFSYFLSYTILMQTKLNISNVYSIPSGLYISGVLFLSQVTL